MLLSCDWLYLQCCVFLVGICVDDKDADISFPLLIICWNANMLSNAATFRHNGLKANWEFCGHRSLLWEGMRLLAQSYVKVTLCQRGIPRLGAVTGCYSHSEYVGMGVRMGGECYSEVILRSGKMDWTENRCTYKWILQIMENFCKC